MKHELLYRALVTFRYALEAFLALNVILIGCIPAVTKDDKTIEANAGRLFRGLISCLLVLAMLFVIDSMLADYVHGLS